MEWLTGQDKILEKIENYKNANRAYMDESIVLLKLSQKTGRLYEKQPIHEKRRTLNFVCSNSILKDGRRHPVYR